MKLEKFISNTLIDIHKGIQEANKSVQGINETPPFILGYSSNGADETIAFDVAVTVNENVGGSAGGSINVVGLKLGAELETQGKHEQVSRVQFRIHPNYAIG